MRISFTTAATSPISSSSSSMVLPNSQRHHGPAFPLRTRAKGSGVCRVRKGLSCFNVILGLISVQMVGLFLVALNMGNLLGLEARVLQGLWSTAYNSTGTDDSANGDEVIEINTEVLHKWQQLELVDPHGNRTLYPKITLTTMPNEEREEDATDKEQASIEKGAQTEAQEQVLALDNYGSRPHFNKSFTAPYLVVGGSDGSGTRAVVDTLIDLGAFFQVEDRRTKDVHGTEMFKGEGWPPLVNLIMNSTHSANYELHDLPPKVRDRAIEQLSRLKHSIDAHSKTRLRRAKYANRPIGIGIGWKAPVSMLLLPLIREVFGPIKFLHVVRDGRDVSLSENQSPVKKFYNTFYGLGEPLKEPEVAEPRFLSNHRVPHLGMFGGKDKVADTASETTTKEDDSNITAKAMQLWNDWNYQVHEWGKNHADGITFDYLTIRTEDLVNPETRFETLLQLADFVGSKKSLKSLCCMSQKELQDLGKSSKAVLNPDNHHGNPRDRVHWMPGRPGHRKYTPIGWNHGFPARGDKEDFVNSVLYGEGDMAFHGALHADVEKDYLQDGDTMGKDWVADQYAKYGQANNGRLQNHKEAMLAKRKDILERQGLAQHSPVAGRHRPGAQEHVERRLLELFKPNGAGKDDIHVPHRRYGRSGAGDLLSRGRFLGRRRERFQREAPEQVKARYGKWVKALENQPELSQKLHELGERSLQVFGYEPPAQFLDPPDYSFSQQCQEIIDGNVCEASGEAVAGLLRALNNELAN